MRGLSWIKNPRFFYFILAVYLIAGLFNLAYIPVVWLDEAACLEPAIHYHQTGIFASKSWATPGAELHFLSYPPAIIWLHIFTLKFFPLTVFWIRLPFLLLHISAVYFLYRLLLKQVKINVTGAAILASFFLFDKAVFEISRAIRAETIEIFLLSILFLLFYKKSRAFLLGITLGFMLITHLKEWPLAGIFGLYYLIFHAKKIYWPEFIIASLLPLFCYLFFIDFHFEGLISQMFLYSGEHAASGNILHRLADWFWFRFFPVYKEQPWMPLIHIVLLFAALRALIRTKGKDIFAATFIGTSICFLLFLSPNYRYWIPLYFTGMIVLANYLKEMHFSFKLFTHWYFLPVYLLLIFPFVSRHTLAILQRPERNPDKAVQFLEQNIPVQKGSLVFGEEIGVYMAGKYPQMDFGHTQEPDHFFFKDYKKIYLLSHELYPKLNCISTYQPATLHLPEWTYKLGRGGTYSGMKIYEIRSEKEWKSVTKNYYP